MSLLSRCSALALGVLVVTTAHAPAWAQSAPAPAPAPATDASAAPPSTPTDAQPAPAQRSDRPVATPAPARVFCHPEAVVPCDRLHPGVAPEALTLSEEERQLQRRLALRHWALAGVTGVLAAGGAVFGLQSRSTAAGARDARWQIEAYDALRTARGQAVAANAMFIGAGLAAVAGVITYFVSPPLPPEPPKAAPAFQGGAR